MKKGLNYRGGNQTHTANNNTCINTDLTPGNKHLHILLLFLSARHQALWLYVDSPTFGPAIQINVTGSPEAKEMKVTQSHVVCVCVCVCVQMSLPSGSNQLLEPVGHRTYREAADPLPCCGWLAQAVHGALCPPPPLLTTPPVALCCPAC